MPVNTAYSVEEITQYIRSRLEEDPSLQDISIRGEISNLTYHRSGHVYFAVKDPKAQLSCVMFKMFAQHAPRMREGDKVILNGSINVYVPRGSYQLVVRSIQKAGKGDLHQEFLQLKEKLQAKGLFNVEHKQPLPLFPQKIGIITSPTGAAIRDILQTLKRRYPHLYVLLIPAVVQGVNGKDSIIESIRIAEHENLDLIILARGGGSIEDLWNFNEEEVAHAIFQCHTPIISGIGHETDFTIADFVADVRASTPTAAAEQAVPDSIAVHEFLHQQGERLQQQLRYFINFKRQTLDDLSYKLQQHTKEWIVSRKQILSVLNAQLQGMDVKKLLAQGYSITMKKGKIIKEAKDLLEGDKIETILSDGTIHSQVTKE